MSNNETLFVADLKAPTDQGVVAGDEDKDFYSELVGEGKKYKDEKALAKAVAHANAHIARIEAEQADLRLDLAQRLTLEEAVERMTKQNNQVASLDEANTNAGSSDHNANVSEIKPGMSLEEIQALIDSKITEKEQARTQQSNISGVKQELRNVWGDSYLNVLKSKTEELGVDQSFLDNLAASHPRAFLELVGARAKQGQSGVNSPPMSQVNSSAMSNQSNSRDQAYYRNLRRSDPKAYWSARIQSQIHKDAAALGDKFFS